MSVPDNESREALGKVDSSGVSHFDWSLTGLQLTDPVKLVIPPNGVLPVVFVPGIMGSNLKSNNKKSEDLVWRLDKGVGGIPTKILSRWLRKSPGERQSALHPARVEVDDGGATPKQRVGSVADPSEYKKRGWGEVAETSYHDFLIWLEDTLNGQGFNPYLWRDFTHTELKPFQSEFNSLKKTPKLPPGIPMQMLHPLSGMEKGTNLQPLMSDDLLKRAKFRMPVYACGYNWLDSNEVAARELRARIIKIINENNRNGFWCKQVIVVTHSMGGLVARRCAMLEGMDEMIAGVVHGVMPAVGAAVAYRRCKIGMWDEDPAAGLAIGNTGQETTAVFAQAPGALQLLPTTEYRKNWLKVLDDQGKALDLQFKTGNPYDEIYLCRNRWWGLVREEWLRPAEGIEIKWNKYLINIEKARGFHRTISGYFHPETYVYYGNGEKSFESVNWRMKRGLPPDKNIPLPDTVKNMSFGEIRDDGSNPAYIGGGVRFTPDAGMGGFSTVYQSSYWELHSDPQDGSGDGTVPVSSGKAPLEVAKNKNNVRQQFRLSGFKHEPAYKDNGAQQVTLYSIIKIASEAKVQA